MKFIFVILLTTTTWYDGHPYTRGVGVYETKEACEQAREKVLDAYARTFPPHLVMVKNSWCDKLQVPDNYKPPKPAPLPKL